MEAVQVNALVIRAQNYSEADRILTLFSREKGIISAIAKGARKFKSHQAGATQLFCYGRFNLVPGKNMYTLRGAVCEESFFTVSSSIENLALAQYMCDLAYQATGPENPDEGVLSLLLNTLFLLSKGEKSLEQIKAVYELKLCERAGFMPNTACCMRCGETENLNAFSPAMGGMLCAACSAADAVSLSAPTVKALQYLADAPLSSSFGFTLKEDFLCELSKACEKFVLFNVDNYPKSLDYYKKIKEF